MMARPTARRQSASRDDLRSCATPCGRMSSRFAACYATELAQRHASPSRPPGEATSCTATVSSWDGLASRRRELPVCMDAGGLASLIKPSAGLLAALGKHGRGDAQRLLVAPELVLRIPLQREKLCVRFALQKSKPGQCEDSVARGVVALAHCQSSLDGL